MKLVQLYSAAAHLHDFYGIDLVDDDFEAFAFRAIELIGNLWANDKQVLVKVINNRIDLPIDCDEVNSLNAQDEDYLRWYGQSRWNQHNKMIEDDSENFRKNVNPLYKKGRLVSYIHKSDHLIVNDNEDNLILHYSSRMVDEDGLPFISVNESAAIAAYCAYVYTNREGMKLRDQSYMQMAEMIRRDWARKCDQARMVERLTINDINDYLDVKSSWDRKRFNTSFKGIK